MCCVLCEVASSLSKRQFRLPTSASLTISSIVTFFSFSLVVVGFKGAARTTRAVTCRELCLSTLMAAHAQSLVGSSITSPDCRSTSPDSRTNREMIWVGVRARELCGWVRPRREHQRDRTLRRHHRWHVRSTGSLSCRVPMRLQLRVDRAERPCRKQPHRK